MLRLRSLCSRSPRCISSPPRRTPQLRSLTTSLPSRDPTELDQVTRLSNGVRVATEALPGHFSAVGVYVDGGSRYENDRLRGVSHLIDRLAFKSTSSRDGTQMLEKLESLGGNVQCASSRESIMYQAAVFNKDVADITGILAETIRDPLITDQEVAEQLDTAAYEINEIWAKAELILPELVHSAAFQNNTLGNPLLCPEERLAQINRDTILEYRDIFFQPERLVVAFAGVDHPTAVKLTEQYFGDMKSTTPKTPIDLKIPAHYTGGYLSLPPSDVPTHLPQFTHVHVGFEGLRISDPDIYALATLQTLLGGGGSFSAGGPGKGMYSRLYTNVLNQQGWVESCVAFNHSYTDSGLFGIAASCRIGAARPLVNVILKELNDLFASGYAGLQHEEVERAKNQLRSSLLMNLESRMVELEDLGRQVQVHGRKIPTLEMTKKIEELTIDDLRRVAKRVMSGGVKNIGMGTGAATVVVQAPKHELESLRDVKELVKRKQR